MFYNLLNKLSKLYPINGKREKLAIKFILKNLEEKNVSLDVQWFKNSVPNGKCKLEVDGEKIKCMHASFSSGKIDEKNLVANTIVRQSFESPNISFNPYCKDISLATFYFKTSICIKSSDVKKIIEAEYISGKVKIKKEKFKTANILVGKIRNPKKIIFAHFDTVLSGCIDNSASIALLINLIFEGKDKILKDALIVFSGSEELSFEKPYYWGYGYRIFESEFYEVLKKSKSIIVVDCIGFDYSYISKDEELLKEAFPIKNFNKFFNKIFLLTSISQKNIKYFYSFYHSNLDLSNLVKDYYVQQAKRKILEIINQ